MTPRRRARRGVAVATVRILALLVVLLVAVPQDAWARRSSFGGSFGRSSSWGSSRSFSSSRSAFGSSRSTFGARTPGVARTATRTTAAVAGTRGLSTAQSRSIYSTARRNGTTFQSRDAAASSFQQRYGNQYTSSFSSRPSARPSHIPQTTTVNGQQVNVNYDATRGGYGYVDPALGTWVAYSVFRDAAMTNSLMYSQGYWWGGAPMHVSHFGFFRSAMSMIIVFFLVSTVVNVLSRRR